MITEKDLQEAIAGCLGERSPNANTCIKLAAYYTIQNELYPKEEKKMEAVDRGQSFAAPQININSGSDFARAVNRLPSGTAWEIMDELMDALKVINPRLYAGVMRKIEG